MYEMFLRDMVPMEAGHDRGTDFQSFAMPLVFSRGLCTRFRGSEVWPADGRPEFVPDEPSEDL